MKAIEVPEYGDADALTVVERDRPDPGGGEVRVEVEATGVNFADIMQRRGHYPGGPDAPFVPGLEAAGTVDAVGPGVDLEEGDRVVAMLDGGGYAEHAVVDVRSVFPVPEGMSLREAAGFPVQFLTAHNCLHEWGGLEEGERVLVHAAAGGVGTAAVQLADHADAVVFGTASSAEKLELVERLGCDHPINYVEEDFVERVEEITGGEREARSASDGASGRSPRAGVDLVLDGVGGDVFRDSLDALSHFGRLVFYGVASGDPPQADMTGLMFANKELRGFHLGQAVRHDPGKALAPVPELTQLLTSGDLEVQVGETFPLEDAADAHRHIEERSSTGKVLLEP